MHSRTSGTADPGDARGGENAKGSLRDDGAPSRTERAGPTTVVAVGVARVGEHNEFA